MLGGGVIDLSEELQGRSAFFAVGIDDAVTITLSDGNDHIAGSFADDALHGAAGDDRLTGRLGGDVLDGGDGSDWARYDSAVFVSLSAPETNTGEAAGDLFIGIENLQLAELDRHGVH